MIQRPYPAWFVFALLCAMAALAFVFSGCVSLRANERAKNEAACNAMRKCRIIAYHDHALNTVDTINKRFKTQCP